MCVSFLAYPHSFNPVVVFDVFLEGRGFVYERGGFDVFRPFAPVVCAGE
jgi:hypothetical protein